MKKRLIKMAAAFAAAVTSSFVAATNVSAATLEVQELATANPFQEIADWFTKMGDSAQVLFPAIGTVVILVIGIVIATAGSSWGRLAKTLLSGLIVAVAIVAYGPSLLLSLLQK